MMNNLLINKIRKVCRPIKQVCRQKKEKNFFKSNLRSSDIFLVGHPKSGNTWLAIMLGSIIEKNFGKNITLGNVKEIIPYFHANDKKISFYADLPDPRIFRNEGPVYPELYPKTIYLVRDPRSVYVSYYHHCVHVTNKLQWKIEDFVDEMIANGHIIGMEPWLVRWDRQISQWIKRSKNQPVMIVKYEEMIKDRRKVLEEVLTFAKITYNEKDIDVAVKRGSFSGMRKEEQIYGAEPYGGIKREGSYYVRQGKIDGWKGELSQEVVKRIESAFSEVMKKVGYI